MVGKVRKTRKVKKTKRNYRMRERESVATKSTSSRLAVPPTGRSFNDLARQSDRTPLGPVNSNWDIKATARKKRDIDLRKGIAERRIFIKEEKDEDSIPETGQVKENEAEKAARTIREARKDREIPVYTASVNLGDIQRGNIERGNIERGNIERGNIEPGKVLIPKGLEEKIRQRHVEKPRVVPGKIDISQFQNLLRSPHQDDRSHNQDDRSHNQDDRSHNQDDCKEEYEELLKCSTNACEEEDYSKKYDAYINKWCKPESISEIVKQRRNLLGDDRGQSMYANEEGHNKNRIYYDNNGTTSWESPSFGNEWVRYFDEKTGKIYYKNINNEMTTWEKPSKRIVEQDHSSSSISSPETTQVIEILYMRPIKGCSNNDDCGNIEDNKMTCSGIEITKRLAQNLSNVNIDVIVTDTSPIGFAMTNILLENKNIMQNLKIKRHLSFREGIANDDRSLVISIRDALSHNQQHNLPHLNVLYIATCRSIIQVMKIKDISLNPGQGILALYDGKGDRKEIRTQYNEKDNIWITYDQRLPSSHRFRELATCDTQRCNGQESSVDKQFVIKEALEAETVKR